MSERLSSLKTEIKTLIIQSLDLEDITPADIGDDMPLFGEGLGLDSIDALELGLAISKKFAVEFKAGAAENRQHFANVTSLANFIINKA